MRYLDKVQYKNVCADVSEVLLQFHSMPCKHKQGSLGSWHGGFGVEGHCPWRYCLHKKQHSGTFLKKCIHI